MARLRLVFVATSALLLALVPLASPKASVSAASAAIAFSTPSVVDPIHAYGEPDILVDPQGRVFVSGPTGTGTQRSVWNASVDGGQSFRIVEQGPPPSPLVSNPAPQPGGGDTELAVDHSSKQYFADLYALTCLRVATTSDGGASTAQNVYPGGCAGVPGADRQWLRVFDPPSGITQSAYQGPFPLIYMEYNDLGLDPLNPAAMGAAQWTMSTNGLTYTRASLGGEYGADGYPSIDQVTGKVFQAEYDGTGSSNSSGTSNILLNIGTPDVTGQLTFRDDPNGGSTTNLITVARNVPDNSGEAANFVVSSMDSGRNLFVAWVGRSSNPAQRQVSVSVASAASGWTNWSNPVQVSAPPSMVSIFPWVKAGGPGRADVVWYGSNVTADPSTDAGQKWDVYMSQVVFPTTNGSYVGGGPSSVQQVKVTPHPMHYNSACLQGTGCITVQGNRNLADFFQVNIDASGAAEIVYDDTSNGLVQPDFTPTGNQTVDHAGAPLVTVARQSSGPGLLGSAVSGASNTPVSSISDPPGDALNPAIGGSNVTGMDIVGSSLNLSSDGKTLNVTMQLVDLAHPASTALAIAGTTFLQYDTRWQMGNTIFYAGMENTALNRPTFYAGTAQSVDLCSVSACFPHVITYPEQPATGGKSEMGSVVCPSVPSASTPCTLTVQVKVQDVGGPTASSLLEEVGAYSFAASHEQGTTTNAQAEADNVPLEIDGACCYNFKASVQNGPPPACHEADGNGDIHSANSGKASFSMDEDHCEDLDNEDLHAQDLSANMNFQSTQILAVIFNDAASSATLLGKGTDNGNAVTFAAVTVNGAAGVGTFSLSLSDGYTNSGTLLDGSIQLH